MNTQRLIGLSLFVALTAALPSAAQIKSKWSELKVGSHILEQHALADKVQFLPKFQAAEWTIDAIVPAQARPHDIVTIVGDGFDQLVGNAFVRFACGVGCTGTGVGTILSRNDREITVELPAEFSTGPVVVADSPVVTIYHREVTSTQSLKYIGLTTIRNNTGLDLSSLTINGYEQIASGYVLPAGNDWVVDLAPTAAHGQGEHNVVAMMTSIPVAHAYTLSSRVDAGDTLILEILDYQLMGRGCTNAAIWQGSLVDISGGRSFQLTFNSNAQQGMTFRELGVAAPVFTGTYSVGPANPLLLWTVTLRLSGQPAEDVILDDASGIIAAYVDGIPVQFTFAGCS